MTLMNTSTRELDINTLVLTAYQYAGVINEMATADGPQWLAKAAYGRRHLELIVDSLAADGIYERSIQFYDLDVTAGSVTTELPTDTVDVLDVSMLVQTGYDVPLTALPREGYQAISTKDQTGTPQKVYVERGVPMLLYLWPVPEADCTIRLQRQRLTYDNSSGGATVDLERYWMDYLLHELAYRVAMSNGIVVQRCQMLEAKARDAKGRAQGKSGSQLPNRIVVDHRGPYRGR